MRNAHWIPIGMAAGLVAGAFFGADYALVGAGVGLAGGIGVFLGLKTRATKEGRRPH